MALVSCPACDHRVSETAVACPSCGHPGAGGRHGVIPTLGRVAGTYVSANAFSELVLGSVMFVCVAAVLITLILAGR
ncbi:zinc ribbon domain-containing protein [Methylobacterium sp. Leaf118]|uniref:zinc ribbon domain-containing protein n=1 Tax=Methylobacterium sp. Leaf118 TaxID=2876562 RepID=UPI001E36235D|nr:zinc ribbon domain-containing protein [Methylobacterium sp. Leaf118]